jgi:hypothetical protein
MFLPDIITCAYAYRVELAEAPAEGRLNLRCQLIVTRSSSYGNCPWENVVAPNVGSTAEMQAVFRNDPGASSV